MNTNSEHKKTEEDEPWNQTFSGDRDENGNLSRVKLRQQSHNHNLVTITLVALIIMIALVALIYGIAKQSAMGKGGSQQADSSVRVTSQISSKKKSNSDSKGFSKHTKQASSVTRSNHLKKQAIDDRSASVKTNQSRNHSTIHRTDSQSQPTTTSKQTADQSTASTMSGHSNSETHQYATVGAGQGIYRVAVNHGLTMDQLMEMNGLTSSSQIHPGEKLRIR
ncbi:MAG: SAG1386/EF1546 family surface-associated protein [Lentilactobacillus diolivorans]